MKLVQAGELCRNYIYQYGELGRLCFVLLCYMSLAALPIQR
jgi:hypothetical protein